jgi:hypothetical protein
VAEDGGDKEEEGMLRGVGEICVRCVTRSKLSMHSIRTRV